MERVTTHDTAKFARRPALAGLFVFFLASALVLGATAADVFPTLAQSQPAQQSQRTGSITVSAAISLKDALAQLGPMYEKRVPGAKIVFNYGGSGTLEQQIEQGAPADIFFSAATQQMDQLKTAGLVDGALAYPSTGEVIDVASRRILTDLTDEHGAAVQSEKMVEIDFRDGKPDRTGDQFGLGRSVSP